MEDKMYKVGDLVELTEAFISGDEYTYPAGILGIVVDDNKNIGRDFSFAKRVVWVHFQTGYVGAVYDWRLKKAI